MPDPVSLPDDQTMDTVKLRGHHLLCVLTYIGMGYTPGFTKQFDDVVARLTAGAPVEIADGVDEICSALQGEGETCRHALVCRTNGTKACDHSALQDVSRILQMPMLHPGDVFKYGKAEVAAVRREFARGNGRAACTKCSWRDDCTKIATSFKGVKLVLG